MPYASKAQRGKFHVLEREGKISPSTVQEFDSASKGMKLPQYAKGSKAKSAMADRLRRKKAGGIAGGPGY